MAGRARGAGVEVSGVTLRREFYRRPALEVAPQLLNKVLVSGRRRVRIVEVEAYEGLQDPGSHAYRGRTPRTEVMHGPPGHLYVYFTYGMHWCANTVCGEEGVASAVLLRAGAPLAGIGAMRAARPKARRDAQLASGPARLCQAMGIDGACNGIDLTRGPVRVLDDGTPPPAEPGISSRIGLTAGGDLPWRFTVPGDPNLSRTS